MIFSFPPLDLSPFSSSLSWMRKPPSPPPLTPPPTSPFTTPYHHHHHWFSMQVSVEENILFPVPFFPPSQLFCCCFFSSLPLFHLVLICLACWRRNHVLLPAGDHGWDGVVGVLLWIHGHLPSSHAGLLLLWRILLQALSRSGEHQQDPPRPHILSRHSHPHLHGKMRRGWFFS